MSQGESLRRYIVSCGGRENCHCYYPVHYCGHLSWKMAEASAAGAHRHWRTSKAGFRSCARAPDFAVAALIVRSPLDDKYPPKSEAAEEQQQSAPEQAEPGSRLSGDLRAGPELARCWRADWHGHSERYRDCESAAAQDYGPGWAEPARPASDGRGGVNPGSSRAARWLANSRACSGHCRKDCGFAAVPERGREWAEPGYGRDYRGPHYCYYSARVSDLLSLSWPG